VMWVSEVSDYRSVFWSVVTNLGFLRCVKILSGSTQSPVPTPIWDRLQLSLK